MLSHSQNFIKNPKLVTKLLEMTNLISSDFVVEIGSGTGIITKQLSSKVDRVIASEVDPSLISQHDYKNVKIVRGDFLKLSLPDQSYKVFANIPFNLTAQIVKKLFLGTEKRPESAYLIMQYQAAEKFVGYPKTTLLSIILQTDYEVNTLIKIDKKEFIPIPKVDAAFVSFIKRQQPLVSQNEYAPFADFVAYKYKHSSWDKPVTNVDIFKWIELFKNISPDKRKTFAGTMARYNKEQTQLPKQQRTRNW